MRSALLSFVLWIMACTACSGPQPIPPSPGPVPVADASPVDAPPDPFAWRIFDCTGLDTTPWRPYANTCGDSSNTGECLRGYVATGVPADKLACAARDVEVAAFVEVDMGVASADTKARASALRAWLKSTGLTLRGAP